MVSISCSFVSRQLLSFLVSSPSYVAPHRVVVGVLDGAVYRAVVGFQVLADKDMVDAKVEAVLVVGDAESAARLAEGVVEVTGNGMMSIGQGRVVEVATYHYVLVARTFH